MKVSGQIHTPAASPTRNKLPVPTGYDLGGF